MKKILDAMNEARAQVDVSAFRLSSLASAFRTTGNIIVAEQLDFEAQMLLEAIKPLHGAWNADMDEQIKHSDAMMGNLLAATIGSNFNSL